MIPEVPVGAPSATPHLSARESVTKGLMVDGDLVNEMSEQYANDVKHISTHNEYDVTFSGARASCGKSRLHIVARLRIDGCSARSFSCFKGEKIKLTRLNLRPEVWLV